MKERYQEYLVLRRSKSALPIGVSHPSSKVDLFRSAHAELFPTTRYLCCCETDSEERTCAQPPTLSSP